MVKVAGLVHALWTVAVTMAMFCRATIQLNSGLRRLFIYGRDAFVDQCDFRVEQRISEPALSYKPQVLAGKVWASSDQGDIYQ